LANSAAAMEKPTKTVVVTVLTGLVWALCVTAGLRFMLNYERKAGAVGELPAAWPKSSAIARASDRPTLVLFAHPRCPCTRATMGELAQLTARTQDKLRVYVVFFKPEGGDADWTNTDLQRTAAAIPGITVLTDPAAVEAKRFGAQTSGHALLFGPDGALLFSGGITASRGHAGDNAGESAIEAIVNGRRAPQNRTLVFGCSFDRSETLAQASTK
jgi:hypothetical protein